MDEYVIKFAADKRTISLAIVLNLVGIIWHRITQEHNKGGWSSNLRIQQECNISLLFFTFLFYGKFIIIN